MLALFLASVLTLDRASATNVCHEFARTMQHRDIAALRKLAVAGADFNTPQWHDLVGTIEKTRSIRIDREEICSVRDEQGVVTVRLMLTGSAISLGQSRQIEFPEMWRLEIDAPSLRIRSAMPAETVLAQATVAKKDDEERRRLLALSEFDPRSLPSTIAAIASDATGDEGSAAMRFAIQMSRMTGDRAVESTCLRLDSGLHVTRHEFGAAIETAEQSLAVARASRSVDAECAGLFTLGIAEWLTDDPAAAVRDLDAAGTLVDDIDDPRSAIKSIYMAGFILQGQGRLSTAIDHAQRSQQLAARFGWPRGVLDGSLLVASIHDQLQNFEFSAQLSHRAYDAALSIGDYERAAFAMYSVAQAELHLGRNDRAIESIQRVLRFNTTELPRSSTLDLLGQALTAASRYEEADTVLREAVAIAKKEDDGRAAQLALTHLSEEQFRRGRFVEALASAREAISIGETGEGATRSTNDFRPWTPWTAAGRALTRLGRLNEAADAFRHAIDLIESARQSAPSGDETLTHSLRNADAYLALIDLLAREGDVSSAVLVSEKIKGRTLRDVIDKGRVDVQSLMTPAETAQARELEARVAGLSRQLLSAPPDDHQRLTQELQHAEDDLGAFSETIYLGRTRPATATDAQKFDPSTLQPDLVILDYAVTEDSTVAFAITRDARRMKRLPIGRRSLRERVERFSRDLQQRDLLWQTEARELYDTLVKPFESSLRHRKLICIVPDDVLWHVPFEALVRTDGTPLIETLPLFYSPSLSFLDAAHPDAEGGRPRTILAVGDPASAPQALPEAAEEAQAVASLYPDATVLTGRRAKETTIKQLASRYDVLHFATHALIDDRSPMFSCLVFAADDENDGLLQARELVRLNLRARLAVLSACNTGRGAIYPGEGVVGLSWALLLAGCPRSVVTGWMVNSRGAADLMIGLHRELSSGVATAEALRRAALAMREQPQYRHPYYWAAFHVVGIGW